MSIEGARASSSRPTTSAASAWLIVAFSVLGVGISTYLTIQHYAKLAVLCPTSTSAINCAAVLKSAYSTIGSTGIPITVPGMAWFIVSGFLAGFWLLGTSGRRPVPAWIVPAHLIWACIGLASVLYLVYVEAVRLHEFCEWCSGVHALILLTFLTTFVRWQRHMSARYAAQET
ncbi:MAG TPA: vitamin K epoxide reductase family protein [Chloroflexota bacterium]|jgi:uncharacterized membrane protein|nr:vitamin K epoxide reductase family protein [Chloroflexota bacterium]